MLQAYALVAALSELGHDVELVDYDQPATTRYFRPKFSFPPRINQYVRYFRCKRFVKNHQVTSEEHCTSIAEFSRFSANYDVLFTGSDQVWFTGPVQYYDPMYFLDFKFDGIKASYAPSAGGLESFGEFEAKVKTALSEFNFISIRDDNTQRLVSALTDKPITRVCDPTFLHHFDELTTTSSPLDKPYFLIFGNIPRERYDVIKAHAQKAGVETIVTLQYRNDGLANKRIAAPDPITWLNYIKHAAFVYTTYFHGSVFSIKFHRELIAIPTAGRVKKVGTVMADCGLSDRVILNDSSNDALRAMSEAKIDWTAVDSRVNQFKSQSITYLKTVTDMI